LAPHSYNRDYGYLWIRTAPLSIRYNSLGQPWSPYITKLNPMKFH
jgi:hypothetical protein